MSGVSVLLLDAVAETAGAPGSPLNVQCHNVNKDSLVLSWVTPSDNGGSPVLGYYIERSVLQQAQGRSSHPFQVPLHWPFFSSPISRCEVGTEEWVPCHDMPVKTCRTPIVGLEGGKTYQFRVKAVNQAGISNPSKASDPVTMTDPNESKRVMSTLLLKMTPPFPKFQGSSKTIKSINKTKEAITIFKMHTHTQAIMRAT